QNDSARLPSRLFVLCARKLGSLDNPERIECAGGFLAVKVCNALARLLLCILKRPFRREPRIYRVIRGLLLHSRRPPADKLASRYDFERGGARLLHERFQVRHVLLAGHGPPFLAGFGEAHGKSLRCHSTPGMLCARYRHTASGLLVSM